MAKLPHFRHEQAGRIRSYTSAAGKMADRHDIRRVVARLRFEHLDPHGREFRIGDSQTVRLDRQSNPTAGGANLHIQINNPQGLPRSSGTTIGQVVVPAHIYAEAQTCPERNVRQHLENIVRSALIRSCTSNGFGFTVASD